MSTGIWLEVSRVRIEVKTVSVQVKGDTEDKKSWWVVEKGATHAAAGSPTFNEIANGLDKSELAVFSWLKAQSEKNLELVCGQIRIQTK